MSKFLSDAISNILDHNDYRVRDSWHLNEFIAGIEFNSLLHILDIMKLFIHILSELHSPIFSTIANLVMEGLESNVMDELTVKPYYYKRYVDDFVLGVQESQVDFIHIIYFSSY